MSVIAPPIPNNRILGGQIVDGDLVIEGKMIISNPVLNGSTDEYAFKLDYTVNKSAGDDYGMYVNMADTASPGLDRKSVV